MGGQSDRFGQPIPASPGYQTILNPDGSQPRMRNILRLGPGITATDDPNSEATSFAIDISIAGSVQAVDAVSNLRGDLFLLGPSVDKIYVTKNYKFSTDTGGMAYRWNATDTTTDDGVLHIKNSFHSTGRFQPIKPADGMINAQACGPALADVGSITRSFDPTATRAIGSELKRITTILRNSGWAGVYFGADSNGARSYATDGTETFGRSSAPFVPFSMVAVDGAEIVSFTPPAPSGFSIYTETEIDIFTPGYGSRYWTQTLLGGETSFTGVADRTGLSVGDWVMVRLGADNSDDSGVCYCFFFGQIKTITPGSGTTATIETWQCVPEPPSSVVYPGINNTLRQYNKHDMLKIVGFQDYTTISGFNMNRTSFGVAGYRNLTVDCNWTDAPLTCINGLYGDGLSIPNITVHRGQGYDGGDNALAFVTLAKQYNTHIGSFIVYDTSPTPLNARPPSILTTESLCRGTRIDFASVTFDAKGLPCQMCGQTPYQTDFISVGMLVVKGSSAGAIVGGAATYFDCIDYKGANDVGFLMFPFITKSIVFNGQLYTRSRTQDYIFPIGPSSTKTLSLPNHGLTSGFRIFASSVTGITQAVLTGNAFGREVDVTSLLLSGQWMDLNNAVGLFGFQPNQTGYNSLQMRITTNGSFPVGGYISVKHSVFEIDLTASALAVTDTSVSSIIVTAGAPTANSYFIGQKCFDSSNQVWYDSVSTGSGASDWILSSVKTSLIPIFTSSVKGLTPNSGGGTTNFLRADGTWSFSMGTTVPLTNANATIDVVTGTYYLLAASTLTGLHTLTLGNTGATNKQVIEIVVESQGSNYLINDSSATLLLSVASGTKVLARFSWNVGTSKFELASWELLS